MPRKRGLKPGQNVRRSGRRKKPPCVEVGIAFAAGWNDVAAGRGFRKDYEREFGRFHLSYEHGRAWAVHAKAVGIRLTPWVTKFSEWAPQVQAAVDTLDRMGVPYSEISVPAFAYAE